MKDEHKSISEQIAKLIDVKSIVTIMLVGGLIYLVVNQNTAISTDLLAGTIGSVLTYYFARKK